MVEDSSKRLVREKHEEVMAAIKEVAPDVAARSIVSEAELDVIAEMGNTTLIATALVSAIGKESPEEKLESAKMFFNVREAVNRVMQTPATGPCSGCPICWRNDWEAGDTCDHNAHIKLALIAISLLKLAPINPDEIATATAGEDVLGTKPEEEST